MNAHSQITTLPIWCDTPIGRELVKAVVADPPETRISRSDWGSVEIFRTWKHPAFASLKRLHSEWLDRELYRLDATYRATGVWVAGSSDALFRVEDADALVKRLLDGAERAAEREARAA